MKSSNGDHPKPKGNYTGERVKLLRPETYRRVVRLLAEPREHVSIREICRQCRVTDDTVRAIEQHEAVPIAARKQTLMLQAARIAQLAADRVEDQIGDAPLPQSVVTFGVMTDRLIALSGDPSLTVRHLHSIELTDDDLIAFAVARSKAAQAKVVQPRKIGDPSLGGDAGDPSTREENVAEKET